jgi:ribosome-binding protein aMBF1 (putative translation factor)
MRAVDGIAEIEGAGVMTRVSSSSERIPCDYCATRHRPYRHACEACRQKNHPERAEWRAKFLERQRAKRREDRMARLRVKFAFKIEEARERLAELERLAAQLEVS